MEPITTDDLHFVIRHPLSRIETRKYQDVNGFLLNQWSMEEKEDILRPYLKNLGVW